MVPAESGAIRACCVPAPPGVSGTDATSSCRDTTTGATASADIERIE